MLVIKSAKFITSAATASQFLLPDKPMIAVCGRSNVGKSSFINMLANQKRLAKTSSTPGRTRLVNYFDFGDFILADLPGYGYAEASKAEKEKWARTLEAFFSDKEKISHVFALADVRRDPTEDDQRMIHFLNYHIIPFTVVATKADKLSRMKVKENVRRVAAGFKLGEANVVAVSSQTRFGKEAVLERIEAILSLASSDSTEKEGKENL